MKDRIKKVQVFKQDYFDHGKQSFPPKLIEEFSSIRMAKAAIEAFGDFSHLASRVFNRNRDELHEPCPCWIRTKYGDEMTEWGYEFEFWSDGVFKTKPEDQYLDFKLYYKVIR